MNATIKTIAMAPASSMANDFHFCAAMVRSLSQLLRQTHILAEKGEVCTGFSQISAQTKLKLGGLRLRGSGQARLIHRDRRADTRIPISD
jgi:hypothetical protein